MMRCRCKICGNTELASSAGGHFRCTECKRKGLRVPANKADPWIGKDVAIARVSDAVRDGQIPPVASMRCVDCGEAAAHYDHRDYSKPLEVEPVCRSCNALRGPALPTPGSVARLVALGLAPYRNKAPVARLLQAMGKSDAALAGMPNRLTNEHWRTLVAEFTEPSKEAA